MTQNSYGDGAGRRVIDYSDPAQLPHEKKPRRYRSDTGGYVTAGVITGMLIVGGFAYAGYMIGNLAPLRATAAQNNGAAHLTTSSIGN